MRKLILSLFLVMFCNYASADQITYPTIWGTNDVVTAVKLNNNNNAVSSVVNGNLDNGNMKSGYSLFQTVSSLPSAGSQGRVDFLTSDNSLNLDTGAAWIKTITPSGSLSVGQIPLYNASWGLLNPGAQYLPLVSNGASSLPSYQILPIAGGGTGSSTAAGSINALLPSQTGNSGKFLTTDGSVASWGTTHGVQIFTSSGTFTAPAGITKVYLTSSAGGGGGGGAGSNSSSHAGGGASGQYVINYPYTVVAGNSYTVTIGALGAGGDATPSNGSNGGNTSFDSLILLGGNGGALGNSTNGAGGAALTPSSTRIGGILGFSNAGQVGSSAGGGGGGFTLFSAGGDGGVTAGSGGTPTSTAPSANTGAGGGGAVGLGGGNVAGSNGGSGICIVQY